jgi:hypothetical protein
MTTLIAGSSEVTDEREVLTLISLYGARVSLGLRSAAPPSERGKGPTIPQLPREPTSRSAEDCGRQPPATAYADPLPAASLRRH